MSNYYILSINSLIKTFSEIEAGNVLNFEHETQYSNISFNSLSKGDYVYGFVG